MELSRFALSPRSVTGARAAVGFLQRSPNIFAALIRRAKNVFPCRAIATGAFAWASKTLILILVLTLAAGVALNWWDAKRGFCSPNVDSDSLTAKGSGVTAAY